MVHRMEMLARKRLLMYSEFLISEGVGSGVDEDAKSRLYLAAGYSYPIDVLGVFPE